MVEIQNTYNRESRRWIFITFETKSLSTVPPTDGAYDLIQSNVILLNYWFKLDKQQQGDRNA